MWLNYEDEGSGRRGRLKVFCGMRRTDVVYWQECCLKYICIPIYPPHTHTHARTHARTHTRTRTHTHTHARTHTHIHTHKHTRTYIHARTHTHTHRFPSVDLFQRRRLKTLSSSLNKTLCLWLSAPSSSAARESASTPSGCVATFRPSRSG